MLHDKQRLLLIAGPCSLESESNCRTVAKELKALATRLPELNIIFKGSYDKANRTSSRWKSWARNGSRFRIIKISKKRLWILLY
jgi:phospho-2-dehydro-3-deoxyheptonate aldolase